MAGISLADATAHRDDCLTQYMSARKAANASSGGRSWTPHALAELRADLTYWQRIVDNLSADSAGANNALIAVAKWT